MVDDIPQVYHLERIEQVRAIADDLRQRIFQVLQAQPMTVTQVGAVLGLPPAKVHYHVRELERVGLVRLVETRERGGILEKYFRSVAHMLAVPPDLLQTLPPSEHVAVIADMVDGAARGFLQALNRAAAEGLDRTHHLMLDRRELWISDGEFAQVQEQMLALLEPYTVPRQGEGIVERSLVQMSFPVTAEPEGPIAAGRRRVLVAGAYTLRGAELERVVRSGEQLDLTVFGVVAADPNVTPELVDRAVGSFHHRGWLRISPEMRRVLATKHPE